LVASFDLWPREKKFQKKTWQAEEKNYMQNDNKTHSGNAKKMFRELN